MNSLYREVDGNVVLRAGTFTMRFYPVQWGACPREFWSEPFPILTNPFPGSAASLCWDRGQDPTQASCDGITGNPIARMDNPLSVLRYNYYGRESIFMPSLYLYEVDMFMPDFWLSHEAMDDYILASAGDSGWRTAYNRGIYGAVWNTPSSKVIFDGASSAAGYGIFMPGNQLYRNNTYRDIAHYPEGRFAGKIHVSFFQNNKAATAGFVFRKRCQTSFPPTLAAMYSAPGYSFTVNNQGKWTYSKVNSNGTTTYTKTGSLTSLEKMWLFNPAGVELQVRTHNGIAGYLELYVNGRLVYVTNDTDGPILGPFCGLYANSKGPVTFDRRQFFDVSTHGKVAYQAVEDKVIRQTLTIEKMPGADDTPMELCRAGFGIFMSQTTFPTDKRSTFAIKEDGTKEDVDGQLIYLKDYKSLWVGNEEGTVGVKATPGIYTVDGKEAAGAHALLQRHSFNDEFYLGLNPLPPGVVDMPVSSIKMVTDYTVTL